MNPTTTSQAISRQELSQAIQDVTGAPPRDPAFFELGPGLAYVVELPSLRLRYLSVLSDEFPKSFANVVEAAGRWDEVVVADDRERFLASWETLARGEPVEAKGYRMRASRRGGFFPIKDYRVPLRDLSGAVVGALGRLVDDSFRSAAMDSLARRSWQEIATAMTRRFLHDFNNTIAGIYSLSELYAEPGSDPKSMVEAMGYIRDNSIRGQAITAKIRQLTTLEPGEASYHNLDTLARDQEDYIKALLPKGAEVHYEASDGELAVRLDANIFRQAILHLACNSRDATGNDAVVTIRCSRATGAAGRHFARLTFADNGNGIKESQLAQALEPFFTTKEGHAGLGLNIVKEFVDEPGGALALSCPPGQGLTVTLDFPLIQLGDASDDEESQPVDAAKQAAPNPATPEPEPVFRQAASELLIYSWEDIGRHPLLRAIDEAGWNHRVLRDASDALLAASAPDAPLRGALIFKSPLDERVGPLVSELSRIRGGPPIALVTLGESVDALPEALRNSCGLAAAGNQKPGPLLDRLSQLFR